DHLVVRLVARVQGQPRQTIHIPRHHVARHPEPKQPLQLGPIDSLGRNKDTQVGARRRGLDRDADDGRHHSHNGSFQVVQVDPRRRPRDPFCPSGPRSHR
ncbi:unnamed protein product, partial [Mycena citricolor]